MPSVPKMAEGVKCPQLCEPDPLEIVSFDSCRQWKQITERSMPTEDAEHFRRRKPHHTPFLSTNVSFRTFIGGSVTETSRSFAMISTTDI